MNPRILAAALALALLMVGPFLAMAAILSAEMNEAERGAAELLLPRLPLGAFLTVIGFLLGLRMIHLLFGQYVLGPMKVAEQLRLMLGANRSYRVAAEGPPEMRELARAANDLAAQRDALLADVEAQVLAARAKVEEERNRLAALMSELAQAVVVCNLDGRILLYNQRARSLFETSVGLGRSIFSILERGQIAHALENVRQRMRKVSAGATANFIATTAAGRLLRVQMAAVLGALPGGEGAPEITGYVLTVDDITAGFERAAARDRVLHALTDGSRAALGSIRAAVEMLRDSPGMAEAERERFTGVIGDEVTAMSQRLDATMGEFADSLKTRWPLEDVQGADLVEAARRRIEARLGLATRAEALDDGLWVRADSFSLIHAITFLAARLQDEYGIRELRFRLSSEGRMAFVDMIWPDVIVSTEALFNWELEPMTVGEESNPLTLRDVVDRHGGEVWHQRESERAAFFRVVLPVAAAPEPSAARPAQPLRASSRPEFYDFDLFHRGDESHALDDRRLADLAFTVFDTETTGLEPSKGDEIIQIGAVRIVNGRLLPHESFEQLVDPRRPLSREGTAIHGITAEMLAGQPVISEVLPRFHRFCEDTVLVAHNAAFDMRFLQLKEAATGIRFTQPLLDTLLLSAVAHPNQESHALEDIAARLGVPLIGRHTALGDAIVTGEVFLRLVALLDGMGIHTLEQAREAARKTFYAKVTY
ncbi:MAG: exonuclease domain-containing protein [Candidatus Nitricoxidivorans perseverans]|uniref:DNA-directed DNA polymerase n=1 Tax=Candidatus Nitricoxidivorans perseverans TaxID=2975601 RepID=A0AA49FLS3_9PROT|nr:MAG: exonuclease domain-containing protein [Candidatus Nitricoxidivorans perseverans]